MVLMMNSILVVLAAVTTSSLVLSTASADPYPFGKKFSGDGTYYGNVSPGEGNFTIESPVLSMYDGMIPMAVPLYGLYDDSKIYMRGLHRGYRLRQWCREEPHQGEVQGVREPTAAKSAPRAISTSPRRAVMGVGT